MRNNVVKEKSYAFAIAIVLAYQVISQQKREYILSKQMLRCGTATGALIREAEYAESTADFIHKMAVALKEAKETSYWLDLLMDTLLMDSVTHATLKQDLDEIERLLVAIIKTSKRNQQK
ncbi:MAG: four helix bundle protein [Chitinophagaceae bacterium]|nr:MAG: four helix bundle protein [Chitinophagaceae bacterium]